MKAETSPGLVQEGAELAPAKRSNAFGTRRAGNRPLPPLRPCQWREKPFRPKRENPLKPAKSCSPECRMASWKSGRISEAQITKILVRLSKTEDAIRLLADLRLDQRIKDLERHIANVEALVAGGGR